MPPDPEAANRRIWQTGDPHPLLDHIAAIGRKVDAGEPVDIEPTPLDALVPADLTARWQSAWQSEPHRLRTIGPDPTFAVSGGCGGRDLDPELDDWRTTYGRLDIPVRSIDRRITTIAAGVAALTLAAIAHRTVRHGR